MEQEEQLTLASAFAAEVEGRGRGSMGVNTVSQTFRLPVEQVAALGAIAQHSGRTKRYVLSNLLELGINSLFSELDKATTAKLRKLQGKHLAELLQDRGVEQEAE